MIDGRTIKIRTIHESYETWLCLEGTILSYNERIWADWGVVSIPIELIEISESKRFNGRRLIAASLSVFLGFAVGGILLWLLSLLPYPEIKDGYWGWIFGSSVVLGLVGFVVFLVLFFIRQRAVTFCIAPQKKAFDFWVQRGNAADIDLLIHTIQQRKPLVRERMDESINQPVGEVLVQPWKRTAALVFLCTVPAMVLEIEWMFLFGLVPLVLHGFSIFSKRTQPLAFKKAMKLYLKGERGLAVDMVSKAIDEYPDFIPARLLKIRLLIRLESFQEAQALLEDTARLIDPETTEWIRKEIQNADGISIRKQWREPA
jgi:hypothetical protein